jgi:cytochrome c biogenesis protein CcdA/thiol-disulfide isomerase/thioredoxin
MLIPVVLLFAFVAGVLTILAPCTLPIVPFVLGAGATDGGSVGARRRRTAGFALGFAGTFVATAVLLASALAAAGVTTAGLRLASLGVLAAAGILLLAPPLRARLAALTAAASSRLSAGGPRPFASRSPASFGGGLLVGASVALVWAPCVGPIMAATLATAVVSGPTPEGAAVALAYVAGALVPLLAIARFGRRAMTALGAPRRRARLEQGFGGLMIVGALVIATGLDVPLQASVANVLPAGWSDALLAVEAQAPTPAAPAAAPAAATPAAPALEDLGRAPELTGITAWINSDPLTLASLRGKVVLVHFWTFACINCLHVQPYVKAWYDRYADEGFTVVGVHTPELSFERDLANVRDAVAKDDVRFPVAFDPDYATWQAYDNHYWPAFFFVDRQGRIRHVHFGEGDYDGSEAVIRELLAQPA